MMEAKNKIVLERISFTYSSTYGDEFQRHLSEHIDNVYRSPKAQWLKSIRATVTHCRIMKDLEAEIIIYTELLDIQTTEFVLRFA